MSSTVLIIGESGTGKSTSIRNLDHKETYIINVLDKPLPFKKARELYKQSTKEVPGNYYFGDDGSKIISCIEAISKRPEIKNLIIDDYQYVMANEFMKCALEKGYDKFSRIGQTAWQIINKLSQLRSDLYCFVLSHSDIGDDGKSRCKTIGKMLNDKICLEGMFTIVLHTVVSDGKYSFLTNSQNNMIAKSPMGMFENNLIENDLLFVRKKMTDFLEEDINQ